MNVPFGIERRDPVSGVLSLGRVLTNARNNDETGRVEVRGKESVHSIDILSGAITNIDSEGSNRRFQGRDLPSHIESIFLLQRPHVIWTPDSYSDRAAFRIDPRFVVVNGIARRRDLFDPRPLLDRIPVETLRIDSSMMGVIRRLPFSDEEYSFIEKLRVPTPIPMILWKRGLEPRHAGALLMALNLTGCFDNHWVPGDLPRSTTVTRIRRKMKAGCSDAEVLGVSESASTKELDRAFRKISYELHPDRVIALPDREAERSAAMFTGVSQAYDRLKRSRRARPVRGEKVEIGKVKIENKRIPKWNHFLQEALNASHRGDKKRAQVFAVKALASNPPESARYQIMRVLRQAA